MNQYTIAAIINAAARACGVSAKSVAGIHHVPVTWEIANARRCAAVQLHHLRLPENHAAAALHLSKLDHTITLRIGDALMKCEPDATIHRSISQAVPGAFHIPSVVIPPAQLVRAAAQVAGLEEKQIAHRTRGYAARDARSAALYLAIIQGSPFDEVSAAFHLTQGSHPNTITKNARNLTTCDLRFSQLISRIHRQALSPTTLAPAIH